MIHAREVVTALSAQQTVSGQALARRLGVTRAAVWKRIEALRAQGLPIESLAGVGYRLPFTPELLDREMILQALPVRLRSRLRALDVYWSLDSTSSELLRRAPLEPGLACVLAECQEAGRGRRGRNWHSPPAMNLYLSMFRRFEGGFASLAGLSLAAGVAATRALNKCGLQDVRLKWPNDVLHGGAKLAGILIESGGEFLGPCFAVIGVGINLRLPRASRVDLDQPVTDLSERMDEPPSRNALAAQVIASLIEATDDFSASGFPAFAEEYALLDALNGRALRVETANGVIEGDGEGVDARGALRVRHAGGASLFGSAEVTVRAK